MTSDDRAPLTPARVEELLFEAFPRRQAEPWDRVGLSVGDPDAPLSGPVALALDVTVESVRAAHAAGAGLLVTHHPCFLDPPARVGPSFPPPGPAVWEAARLGVALVAMHTNLDRSRAATGRLPELLGFSGVRCGIEAGRAPADGALGSVCDLPAGTTLEALAGRCRDVLGAVAQVFGEAGRAVGRAAFFTGSLGSCGADALAAGADVVVCGECGYHRALDLLAQGCAVIILGHDVSEEPLVDLLTRALEERGVAPERLVRLGRTGAWHPLGCAPAAPTAQATPSTGR